ncbi:hypothetical protein DSM104443_01309 [Usitatibacter rugosus]|uniref:DUF3311 domain-containing protein n=1 Tax=Usitatibacter rugosus TaxID=2732067 RepID=A0A6M4GTA1_9PROT|nr:hypothetical protein [Usitatibacter rugosus]QJR10255.1 hypothetical protein DSM104443_01309 [Usitatibacter rugosus]
MKRPGRRGTQLACLFLLGCVLFNFPLLAIFNVPVRILGIPVLYAYMFAAWLLLIVLLAVVMERKD